MTTSARRRHRRVRHGKRDAAGADLELPRHVDACDREQMGASRAPARTRTNEKRQYSKLEFEAINVEGALWRAPVYSMNFGIAMQQN